MFIAVIAGICAWMLTRTRAADAAGGRSRGAAWHTARVAMRPTYRVRIEYCVP